MTWLERKLISSPYWEVYSGVPIEVPNFSILSSRSLTNSSSISDFLNVLNKFRNSSGIWELLISWWIVLWWFPEAKFWTLPEILILKIWLTCSCGIGLEFKAASPASDPELRFLIQNSRFLFYNIKNSFYLSWRNRLPCFNTHHILINNICELSYKIWTPRLLQYLIRRIFIY